MENNVLSLIAMDEAYIPISSLDAKLKRGRKNLATEISGQLKDGLRFVGEKSYAFTEKEDINSARSLRLAVDEFRAEYPKYGAILEGKIAEKRVKSETHLYFGLREKALLSHEDYMGVMRDLGILENKARIMYPALISVSRDLQAKRNNSERSVLV